jgi:N-acyl homoserine lactone hydrolase
MKGEKYMSGITIKTLHCGNMGLDKDALVEGPNNLTASRRQAQREWYACPSFSYVINHPDGRILFDASVYRGWQNEWPMAWQESADYSETSDEEFFEARLKQMNLDPSDFKYVFLSHMHSDHCGNARLFAGTNAQILVHEKELSGVANLEADDKNAWNFFLSADYSVSGLKYTTLYGDMEIMKGIRAISLPGHTWGTMGLLVELEHSGTIILSSDALYVKESYGPPASGAMIDWDRAEWLKSVNKLKLLQKAHDAMIIPGHDHNVIHHNCSCHPLKDESKLRIWPEAFYE